MASSVALTRRLLALVQDVAWSSPALSPQASCSRPTTGATQMMETHANAGRCLPLTRRLNAGETRPRRQHPVQTRHKGGTSSFHPQQAVRDTSPNSDIQHDDLSATFSTEQPLSPPFSGVATTTPRQGRRRLRSAYFLGCGTKISHMHPCRDALRLCSVTWRPTQGQGDCSHWELTHMAALHLETLERWGELRCHHYFCPSQLGCP